MSQWLLDAKSKTPNTLPSHFYSVGKSLRIFSQPPTMGLACDPAHPALASFPTAFHADMQWWEIMRAPASCFDLTSAPVELTPIIYAIDDFHINRKLAFVFEANVGSGKLLACSWDLLSPDRQGPAASQFLHSLVSYAESASFNPRVTLDESFAKIAPAPSDAK